MSGIEVAGLVLGAIPLLVAAIEHYRRGLSTIEKWRKDDREWRSIVRILKTEHVKMQNVCEKLLLDLVQPAQVELMIKDPTCSLWQDEILKRKLRARLSESVDRFEETIIAMEQEMKTMSEMIGLEPEGQSLHTQKSYLRKYIKRISFAINRDAYKESLSVIRAGISDLDTLIQQNVGLEPSRQERSQVKLLRQLRELSLSLYRALQQSISCPSIHNINLKLCTRPSHIIHSDSEAKRLEELDFHLALSCPSSTLGKDEWQDLRIHALPVAKQLSVSAAVTPNVGMSGGNRTKEIHKGVRFQLVSLFDNHQSTSSTVTQTIGNTSFGDIAANAEPKKGISIKPNPISVANLCEKIWHSQSGIQVQSYGVISDLFSQVPREYSVLPRFPESQGEANTRSAVSLRQVLTHQKDAPLFTLQDKLQLAVVVATSVLQLYNTPWLPVSLSIDDILFIQKRNEYLYDNTFMMRGLPDNSTTTIRCSSVIREKRNPTLLSLGFILIELCIGKTLLPHGVDSSNYSLDDYYVAAQNTLLQLRDWSPNYFSAVSRCLHGKLHKQIEATDGEEFQQNMYSGVVALLKKDLEALS